MASEIEIEGVEYISSKRASEMSGYAQDYIGQLARGGYINARRIGGLWHVSLASLQEYKNKADNEKGQQVGASREAASDSLLSFDGKDFVSAPRGAHLTGYHQDYVAQLARSGTIMARQVGSRWYVERDAILAHKVEKDRLLGAVQSESVGIGRVLVPAEQKRDTTSHEESQSYFKYTKDDATLLPETQQRHADRFPFKENPLNNDANDSEIQGSEAASHDENHIIPIRVHLSAVNGASQYGVAKDTIGKAARLPRKAIFYWAFSIGMLATVSTTLLFTLPRIKSSSVFAGNGDATRNWRDTAALTAGAAGAFVAIGDVLEKMLVPELVYKSTQ